MEFETKFKYCRIPLILCKSKICWTLRLDYILFEFVLVRDQYVVQYTDINK